MNTSATTTARSSIERLLLLRRRGRPARFDDERQPVLADDADLVPTGIGAPVGERRGPLLPEDEDDARWGQGGLATPRVPTATSVTPPAPKASSFAPRRRVAARTTTDDDKDQMTATMAPGEHLVCGHVAPPGRAGHRTAAVPR